MMNQLSLGCAIRYLVLVWTSGLSLAQSPRSSHRHHRILSTADNGNPTFLVGNLGTVTPTTSSSNQGGLRSSGSSFQTAAKSTLESILDQHVGFDATRQDVNVAKLGRDKNGGFHFRFKGTIDGIDVEAASMMMHVNEDGIVYALNGELISISQVRNTKVKYSCTKAMQKAMTSSLKYRGVTGKWVTDCDQTYVRSPKGDIHKAWKRTFEYTNAKEDNRYGVDQVFASVSTGDLVAYLPQIHGGLSVETRTCNQGSDCSTVVNSTAVNITTPDEAINRAHNYAIGTYTFYNTMFGRDSINDAGMKIISNVHYSTGYNNAYWNGASMTYGDGDGVNYRPFSMAVDVVAHELTHGVTQYESGLIYSDESGALNEAMSDIFGASVQHIIYKSSILNTMLLGEDLVIKGGAFRSLSNPYQYGCYDYYPERYAGSSDNGGVHWNSGIMNLAFALMVNGGKHPRSKTTNTVPAIDANFTTSIAAAAKIFYDANTQCLTPSSGFREARLCTEQFAGNYSSSVSGAWEAVGVSAAMVNATKLTNGTLLTGQSAAAGEVHYYYLSGVKSGETVTCAIMSPTQAVDADLFVSINGLPVASNSSSINSCVSTGIGPNQTCTTQPAGPASANIYAAVKAVTAYSGLSVVCTRDPPPITSLKNGSPLPGQALKTNLVKYYSLSGIKAGETVTVQLYTSETGSDADLYVRWGSLPVLTDGSTWSCYKYTSSSNETCNLTASADSTLYVLVHAYAGFNSLTVLGRHYPSLVQLSSGLTLASRSSATLGLIQDYQLPGVSVGSKVRCSLAGNNGDADLFVRFGALAETSTNSTVNACTSATSTSKENCTTGFASAATTAYVAVYTKATYTGLNVSCAIVSTLPPTNRPTLRPTKLPTKKPTSRPTSRPTMVPTQFPTDQPTFKPTAMPTQYPNSAPTSKPIDSKSNGAPQPTDEPSTKPTSNPTNNPIDIPTKNPTENPTSNPTSTPTSGPTQNPTNNPTESPTENPTKQPTTKPTINPTEKPTKRPTLRPTKRPTKPPTSHPTKKPTKEPTKRPTKQPIKKPTPPTKKPIANPTRKPTKKPTAKPTAKPAKKPTSKPTKKPTSKPTFGACRGTTASCTASTQCCSGVCKSNKKCQ